MRAVKDEMKAMSGKELKRGPLTYAARAVRMFAAPVGWTAIIGNKECAVAMFCTVHWYDGRDYEGVASLVSLDGRMVLAEQQDGFDSVNPPSR